MKSITGRICSFIGFLASAYGALVFIEDNEAESPLFPIALGCILLVYGLLHMSYKKKGDVSDGDE